MLENLDLVPTASQLNQNFCLDHSDSLKKKRKTKSTPKAPYSKIKVNEISF